MAPNFSTISPPSSSHSVSSSSTATPSLSRAKSMTHVPSSSSTSSSVVSSSNNSSAWSSRLSTVVLDRSLFRKFDEVSSEIDRISRMSTMSLADMTIVSSSTDTTQNNGTHHPEMEQLQGQLERVQQSSSRMLQSQKELLDKIERHERSSLRRYFTFNRDQKIDSLKLALCEKMAEAVEVDAELQRLERRSDSLLEDFRTSLYTSTQPLISNTNHNQDEVDLQDQLAILKREKQIILRHLLNAVSVPDAQQMQTRIAMYSSEVTACESIKKQVDKCAAFYRQALQLLRGAMVTVVASDYRGSVKEFAQGPYLFTVEAGQLVETASHLIQPEARRRYREFAPELVHVHPPKFPQVLVDFARRTRTNFDPHSTLALEASRQLGIAENVIVQMHKLVIHQLEVIDKWRRAVTLDQERAATSQRRLEIKLQQRMAVLARSVSV